MKKLIDFIAKEILFCFDGYKTESDNGFFVNKFFNLSIYIFYHSKKQSKHVKALVVI